MEHRWGHRLEVNEPVRLRVRGGQWVNGRIRNASISGAFIATRLSVTPLAHISVRFPKSRGTRTEELGAQELEGQVVRSTRTGLAIEWLEFAPARVRTLIFIPAFEALWSAGAGSNGPGSPGETVPAGSRDG